MYISHLAQKELIIGYELIFFWINVFISNVLFTENCIYFCQHFTITLYFRDSNSQIELEGIVVRLFTTDNLIESVQCIYLQVHAKTAFLLGFILGLINYVM